MTYGPQSRSELEETGIEPVDNPEFNLIEREPLTVEIKVPVKPTVDLGDYRKIRQSREKVVVTEAQKAAVLSQLREQHVTWVPVDRKSLRNGGDAPWRPG